MLIRVSGSLHSLYPSDGGLVNVETVNYVEGIELILCEMLSRFQ